MRKPIGMFAIIAGLFMFGGCVTTLDSDFDGVAELDVEVTVDGYPYWTGIEYVYINPYHYYYRHNNVVYLYDHTDQTYVIVDHAPHGYYILDRPIRIPHHYYRHSLEFYRHGPTIHRPFRHDGYAPNRHGSDRQLQNRPLQKQPGHQPIGPVRPKIDQSGPIKHSAPSISPDRRPTRRPPSESEPRIRRPQSGMPKSSQASPVPSVQPRPQIRRAPISRPPRPIIRSNPAPRSPQPRIQPRPIQRAPQPRMQTPRSMPRPQPRMQMPRSMPRIQPRMQAPRIQMPRMQKRR